MLVMPALLHVLASNIKDSHSSNSDVSSLLVASLLGLLGLLAEGTKMNRKQRCLQGLGIIGAWEWRERQI